MRVALDVDAGLRLGPAHVGPQRSPLHDAADVVELAQEVGRRDGLPAGRGDDLRGPGGRRARRGAAAPAPLGRRTPAQGGVGARSWRTGAPRSPSALHEVAELEFWNAGGSGVDRDLRRRPGRHRGRPPGPGLLVPGLFDHYRSFDPLPAAFFGLRVVRAARRRRVATVARRRADRLRARRARTAPPCPGRRPACT